MDLQNKINAAESFYIPKLESFFNTVFRKSNLDSHGLNHHRRVWLYCRELLDIPEIGGSVSDTLFPVKLLIAAYLHDSGMSVDPGPRHGHLGKIFCEQFLIENGIAVINFTDLLDTIENHDNKEYSGIRSDPDLLSVLSVADDLDALGYIGIYRYLEIYLVRQIPYEELGSTIKMNVTGRFENFIRKFGHIHFLVEKHRKRCEIISDFCSGYDSGLKSYEFGTINPSGFCGIAEIIHRMLEVNVKPSEAETHFGSQISGEVTLNRFFSELNKELQTIS